MTKASEIFDALATVLYAGSVKAGSIELSQTLGAMRKEAENQARHFQYIEAERDRW